VYFRDNPPARKSHQKERPEVLNPRKEKKITNIKKTHSDLNFTGVRKSTLHQCPACVKR